MTIYILVVRDPDASNEYRIEPADADVQVIDVDLGCSDLSMWCEFKLWAESHLTTARALPASSSTRGAIEDLVWHQFEEMSGSFSFTQGYGADEMPDGLDRIGDVDQLFAMVQAVPA